MRGNLVTGADYLFKGFHLITQPGLRLFVLIPLLINISIFSLLMWLSVQQFAEWIDSLLGAIPSWLDFLRWVLWPLAIIFLLATVTYCFSIVANFIASPFNGLLAEKVEERLSGDPIDGPQGFTQLLLIIPKSLGREVQKLLFYIPLALIALIITFIPLVNVISPIVWFLLGSWMMAIQYVDYPMDNNQLSFKAVKTTVAAKKLTSGGFGMLVMAGTMTPIINFVIMPAAICGATAYWVEELKKQSEHGS